MQEPTVQIAHVHNRMPMLVAPGFAEEWLTSTVQGGELVDAARSAALPLTERVIARPKGTTPTAASALF